MIYCARCGRKYPLWHRLFRLAWVCACGVGEYRPGRLSRSMMYVNPRRFPVRVDLPDFGSHG
jgi:hypothetical protein